MKRPGLFELADQSLSAFLEPAEYDTGEMLIRQSDETDCLFLIDEGSVRIEVEAERCELDTEAVLAIAGAGAIIGELGLLDQRPRSASVVAHTPVKVRKLTAEKLEALEQADPVLAMHVYRELGRAAAEKVRVGNESVVGELGGGPDPAIEAMIRRAINAQEALLKWDDATMESLLRHLAGAIAAKAGELAQLTVEVTRMGDVESKTRKNLVASLGLVEEMSTSGFPGYGKQSDADGVAEVSALVTFAAPVGVVFGLIPATNPVATAIFKTLICLKSRNALILSFHRSTARVRDAFMEILEPALAAAGAPEGIIQAVPRTDSSRQKTEALFRHPGVEFILATGGASMVRAAYSSGKPAIGVGAGNTPVLICADADLAHAAQSVAISKSFDCGLICGSEHNLVVVESVAEAWTEHLARNGVAVLTFSDRERFLNAAVMPGTGQLRRKFVGRPAIEIAAAAGIECPPGTMVLAMEADPGEIAPDFFLAREKMAPLLSFYRVTDAEAGLAVCRELLEIEGRGHTAIIHTADRGLAERFAEQMAVSRILVNSPGTQGVFGMTTSLTPSLTLGCGTWGGTSTTDNVTFRHLQNMKRMASYRPPRWDF